MSPTAAASTLASMRRPISTWRLFTLACWLCALPLLVSHYPPMTDMPQHAAQIAAIRGVLAHDWPYASLFALKPFTPYWLGYGLVLLLSYPFGVLVAIKIVVGLSVVAFPWSAARFCRRLGVPDAWSWWLLPLSLGLPFQWGFLSFIVAMPLAFLFLAAMEDAPPGGARRWLRIAAWVHVLFFAHVLIAAFACVIAALRQCSRGSGIGGWLRRCAPMLTVLPAAAAWLAITLGATDQPREAVQWGLGPVRLLWFLQRLLGTPELPASAIVAAIALAFPWLAGARWRADPARWLPFAFHVAFVLLFPAYALGNAYTASRFTVFALPLYFVCFAPADAASARRRMHPGMLAAGVALALLGWQTLRASIFDIETRGYRSIMADAPPGMRLLSLMVDNGSYGSTANAFLHFPAWYQAEANGLVEPSFALSYAIPVVFRQQDATTVPVGLAWAPERLDWRILHGERYDGFVVRAARDPRAWIASVTGCAMRPVRHSGEWWLFVRSGEASCDRMPGGSRPAVH